MIGSIRQRARLQLLLGKRGCKVLRRIKAYGYTVFPQAVFREQWAIAEEMCAWIDRRFPDGCVILELGGGYADVRLLQRHTVYAVEHDEQWMNIVKGVHYIHAPIRSYDGYSWYDAEKIRSGMPATYDVVLVDGPPGCTVGRTGILRHLDLFRRDVPFLIDDCNRPEDHELMLNIADMSGKQSEIIVTTKDARGVPKKFGVIA